MPSTRPLRGNNGQRWPVTWRHAVGLVVTAASALTDAGVDLNQLAPSSVQYATTRRALRCGYMHRSTNWSGR